MKKKRARISMAIQWTSGTRDTVLELQRRIGISWNFHGIFCIKVSRGWMFLMSPWVGSSGWHWKLWKLWKLENTENEAVVLALRRLCHCCNVSNFVGKSICFLWFQWLPQVCHWKPNSNGWSAASEGGASGASFVQKVTGNDFRPRNLNSFEISWTTRLI